MNKFSTVRFWLSLIILPLLLVGAVYNIGYLVGYNINADEFGLPVNFSSMGLIAAGMCSIQPFIKTIKELQLRIYSKSSAN
ncbi:hypothetical protein L2755_09910 [Shewanella abyssi]|uniref:hypothetical protein n=1 Tax=Shewanella abyssi TaxID=311789 RepID=UPI00200C6804|nr:hypothetical protein [Shewanella abyssi]MCL1049935.1 hypothetical protein [Shewanella abyssi]